MLAAQYSEFGVVILHQRVSDSNFSLALITLIFQSFLQIAATLLLVRIPVRSFLTITQPSRQINWDKIFLFSQDSETKQLSILLLLSSAYKAGVASSAFARERACITIHFGTVLEKWESFTIFNVMNDRLSIDFVLSCSLLTLRDRQREPAMGIFISKVRIRYGFEGCSSFFSGFVYWCEIKRGKIRTTYSYANLIKKKLFYSVFIQHRCIDLHHSS